MSRRPTATILKLIQGDTHVARHRTDAPKINTLPVLPPGCVLSPEEKAMWDWLMEHVVVSGVHGSGDGGSFAKIARLWARVNAVDSKLTSQGLLMKSPRGKPELQPYARLSRDLWQQLGVALAEVGATPAGRVKISGPRGAAPAGEATSWDEID
jgi:hypothetical protein